MSKEKRRVPKLRFPGFTEDWEQRKLIYIFNDFIVPMRDKPKVFSGTTPWTRIEDIEGRYINTSLSGQFVSDETIKSMNLKVIPKGSLIVSASATFGVVAIVNNDLITNQTFIGLVPNKDFDIDFLYSLFEAPTTKGKLLKLSAGSTIFYIARESFENLVLSVPSKEEQIKISKVFKSIDDSITLHQRKLNNLKLKKKALLQKLFPKNGERYPELRFPGFTDAWEQRKLSDISTKVTTKNIDVHYTETLTNSAEQGIISQVDFFDKEISNKDNINGYYIVENNDFIYNPRISTLAPVGPINRNKLNRTGIMSPLYTVFRASNVDLDFLEWYFQSSHWHRYMKLNGDSGARADRIAIKDSTFFDMPIKTPVNIKEQVLIGETLEKFNQYITLHQRKLDHLKLQKKALLQQMFI